MNYNQKVENAEYVVEQFTIGRNESETINSLKQKGLTQSNINSIMLSSERIFYDMFGTKIKNEIDEDGSLLLIDELENADSDWCKKFYDFAFKKIKQEEKNHARRLVKSNKSKEEIHDILNPKLLTEAELESQIENHLIFRKKEKKDGQLFLIGGLIFGAIFIFSLFFGKLRLISGIASVILLYKSYKKFSEEK